MRGPDQHREWYKQWRDSERLGYLIASHRFDGGRRVSDNRVVMAAIKVRIPDKSPLVRLYFEENCPYPGWFARYRRDGKQRKVALSIWDREDLDEARDEAAKLLRCPLDRVQIDGPRDH